MPTDLLPQDADSWESYLSTRDSMHSYTRSAPFDVTLATPGTAENLYIISNTPPTVNLCTNPSFETGDPPTGYTASGAAISQSNTVARNGTFSMLVNPNNLAAGEGAYWTLRDLGAQRASSNNPVILVVSAFFNDNVGSGNGARIEIRNSDGTTTHALGNTVTLAAAWTRSTAFFPLTNTAAVYRIYFVTSAQHNTNFYVDSFQAELLSSSVASTYADGSLGILHEWDGTAHASMSRRRLALNVIKGYRLHTTRDIYLAIDVDASSTTGEFIRAGTDVVISNLHVRSRLSILNAVAGEQPRVYGSVLGIHKYS